MQTVMEFTPKTPVNEFTSDEIRWRLLQAVRDGRIDADLRGVVLGYCAALKRPGGPSRRQEQLCRGLVKEIRRYTGWEDEQLIDKTPDLIDDTAENYAEF